jgi:hypothetical protein
VIITCSVREPGEVYEFVFLQSLPSLMIINDASFDLFTK